MYLNYEPDACGGRKKEHQIPWNWSYDQMCATMWVLGTNSMPCGKCPVLLTAEPLFPRPPILSLKKKKILVVGVSVMCMLLVTLCV